MTAMLCPQCSGMTGVIDSRSVAIKKNPNIKQAMQSVRRRRKCSACGYLLTTYEVTKTQWAVMRAVARAFRVWMAVQNIQDVTTATDKQIRTLMAALIKETRT